MLIKFWNYFQKSKEYINATNTNNILSSAKHLPVVTNKTFRCCCGKVYAHQPTLSRYSRTCDKKRTHRNHIQEGVKDEKETSDDEEIMKKSSSSSGDWSKRSNDKSSQNRSPIEKQCVSRYIERDMMKKRCHEWRWAATTLLWSRCAGCRAHESHRFRRLRRSIQPQPMDVMDVATRMVFHQTSSSSKQLNSIDDAHKRPVLQCSN